MSVPRPSGYKEPCSLSMTSIIAPASLVADSYLPCIMYVPCSPLRHERVQVAVDERSFVSIFESPETEAARRHTRALSSSARDSLSDEESGSCRFSRWPPSSVACETACGDVSIKNKAGKRRQIKCKRKS